VSSLSHLSGLIHVGTGKESYSRTRCQFKCLAEMTSKMRNLPFPSGAETLLPDLQLVLSFEGNIYNLLT